MMSMSRASSLRPLQWSRFLIAVAVLSAFAYGVFVKAPIRYSFSAEHKAEMQALAERVCAAGKTQPCQVEFTGKNKWLAVIPGSGLLAAASPEQLRNEFRQPEWAESTDFGEIHFSNGTYTISSSPKVGSITIVSVD